MNASGLEAKGVVSGWHRVGGEGGNKPSERAAGQSTEQWGSQDGANAANESGLCWLRIHKQCSGECLEGEISYARRML